MLITRRVRMLTPLLAATVPHKSDPEYPRRRFTKKVAEDGSVLIQNDLRRWQWAFLEARDACGFHDVATASIIPLEFYETKRTCTYKRHFMREGRRVIDQFESIPSGHGVNWKFVLTQNPPPGCDGNGRFVRSPSPAELDAMLAYVGEYLGMSEWGHAYLYGKFELQPASQQTTNDGTGISNHTAQ